MNKKNNNKGFTLAELLIVVAIIAVLVAIAIPVFTQQLEKSREATDMANIRAAYAQAVTNYLDTGTAQDVYVEAKQTTVDWITKDPYVGTDIKVTSGSASGDANKIDLHVKCPDVASTANKKYYKISVDASGNIDITGAQNAA